jgi:hypothetical protein
MAKYQEALPVNDGAWRVLGSLKQANFVSLALGALTIVSLFNTMHIISVRKTTALLLPSSMKESSPSSGFQE